LAGGVKRKVERVRQGSLGGHESKGQTEEDRGKGRGIRWTCSVDDAITKLPQGGVRDENKVLERQSMSSFECHSFRVFVGGEAHIRGETSSDNVNVSEGQTGKSGKEKRCKGTKVSGQYTDARRKEEDHGKESATGAGREVKLRFQKRDISSCRLDFGA